MRELFLGAAAWLHLIATVLWIGGIAFILFIAMPSAKQVMGADAGKLMSAISKRFTLVANYSIATLVITGTATAGIEIWSPGHADLEKSWIISLAAKHVLVLAMIIIHFYRGWILAPKIMRTESETKRAAMQIFSLNLVRTNFALGIFVLLLSAIMAVI